METLMRNTPIGVQDLYQQKAKDFSKQARRKWKNTRFLDDKTTFNRISNNLKKQIYKFKNDSLSTFLRNLTTDASTDFFQWKAAKRLKRTVTKTRT